VSCRYKEWTLDRVPSGTPDNSPAIHRWDKEHKKHRRPVGTIESLNQGGRIVAHSYVSALYHCVFSTKERENFITEDLQTRLWPYIGGIARENKMRALAIGGVEDHIHLLLSIPSTLSIAKSMQLIKGTSSKWVHETFPEFRRFEWQEGYGAFSLGISQVADTKSYIENQREHHQTWTFQEEFVAILERHGIEYDPRHIWS
jgi:REP element-mobilizing transposase RayT